MKVGKHLLNNQRGQGLVEYMIIVALMAVGTMTVVRVLSQTTNGKLAQITQALQGGKSGVSVDFHKIEESHLRKKDMSNFFQGSRSTRQR